MLHLQNQPFFIKETPNLETLILQVEQPPNWATAPRRGAAGVFFLQKSWLRTTATAVAANASKGPQTPHIWSHKMLQYVDVFKKILYGCFQKWWVFPPNHPLKNRVFHDFHHPFWGTSIFGKPHINQNDLNFTWIWIAILWVLNRYW